MIITDVPQSGIYFQKGAIVNLVVQFIDDISGAPLQLQTASGLFVDIVYPDRQSIRSFPAQLLTDGTDGKIYYTTQNNGIGYADINQVGLYKVQGRATLAGIALPCTAESDFYILPNAFDEATIRADYPILKANDGSLWKVYVMRGGQLDIIKAADESLSVDVMYMIDATGQQWSVTAIRTAPADAHLDTEMVTGEFPAGAQIFMADSIKKQWVVTVLGTGNTDTN